LLGLIELQQVKKWQTNGKYQSEIT